VRSLPPSYSYFKDDVNNNLGCVPESAVKLDVEGGGEGTVGNGGGEAMDVDNNAAAAALKSEGETPANNNDYDGINEVSFILILLSVCHFIFIHTIQSN